MIDVANIGGVILAGGQSRRMQGQNKSFMTLDHKPMILHVIMRLQAQLSSIAINANDDLDIYRGFGTPVISDKIKNYAGPLAGIASAMEWGEKAGLSHIVTVATDTPFFPENLVQKLAEQDEGNIITIARSGGFKHPAFGIWQTDLHADLTHWLKTSDTMKVMAYVMDHYHDFADFEFAGDLDPFFNVNTPEDLAIAERYLTGGKTQ